MRPRSSRGHRVGPATLHSNQRHLTTTPVEKGQDQIVWPFGSVQVEGYWPQLLTLKPA